MTENPAQTQRYRIEVRHPDEPCLVYDLADPDEPCVFVAQNADEADAWVQGDPWLESAS